MTTNDSEEQAKQQFFMQKPARYELDELQETKLPDKDVRMAFSVFKQTLDEIIGAVQAFYNMAVAAVIDAKFDRRFMANVLRVRAQFIRANKEKDEEEIHRDARRLTNEEWEREDHHDELMQAVANRLTMLSASVPELVSASNNAILRQSTVMLWSAVETLLREYFRVTINNQPWLSKQIFESDEGKRYWNHRGLTIDVIQGADFNLKQCMGDVLLEINPMISLKSIKTAYAIICSSGEDLMKTLKSQAIYNLFALRNLVAHKSGIVDEKFLLETNFSFALGEKITIRPSDFEELYMAAKAIGVNLFECAQRDAARDTPTTTKN